MERKEYIKRALEEFKRHGFEDDSSLSSWANALYDSCEFDERSNDNPEEDVRIDLSYV